ncbi:YihY/virulence factor BrkB family protein [Phenylobacterium sp. VNQ135]|uniref:YihY/virulence factor BrkB family protein n=1 Tax=Phenylobacterium sp. VNQ135 TaxID=3400922 RepID=UPI003C0D5BC3
MAFQEAKPGKIARTAVALAPWAVTAAVAAAWLSTQPRKLPPPPPPPEAPPPPPGLSEALVATPERFEALEPGRGRSAPAPHGIPWRGWKDVLWRTYREFNVDNLMSVAGGITFFTLLAIFPALGVFVSLYGLIADVAAVEKQMSQLAVVFPPEAVRLVGEQMMRLATERGFNLSAAFLVSFVFSTWTANAGMKALFQGLNIAYDEVEKRNFFYRTALTYAFTFAFLTFLTAVTAIMVALPIVARAARLPDWVLGVRWLLLYAVVAASFAFAYRYGPCRKRARWTWIYPGALAAALVWMAGSAGFSWYVNNVAHVQVTYGSLGAAIGFMLWVWFSVIIVLTGAELNAEIEHQTAIDSTVGPPKPMGERGAAMADTVGLPFIGVRKGASLLWGVSRRQVGNLVRRGRKPPRQG